MFIVTTAWLLSLKAKERDLPATLITMGMTGLVAGLLMLQPDFGQTIVFCLVWIALLMISGTPMRVMLAIGSLAPIGLVMAYMFYGVARNRINAFLFPDVDGEGAADHFQVNAAHNTLTAGGWTGTGPGLSLIHI